jgi:hypothetical protein
VDQPRGFREVLSRSSLYLAGFGAYLLLMFSIMSMSLHGLLGRESSRFQIYRMSGATAREVNAVIALFLTLSIVALPVLACAPLLLLGGSFPEAFRVVVVGCVAVSVLEVWRARGSRADLKLGRVP